MFAYVLEEYDIAALANVVGDFTPSARCRYVVVGERNEAIDAQIVPEFDHPVPHRNPKGLGVSPFATKGDSLYGLVHCIGDLLSVGLGQAFDQVVKLLDDSQCLWRRALVVANAIQFFLEFRFF